MSSIKRKQISPKSFYQTIPNGEVPHSRKVTIAVKTSDYANFANKRVTDIANQLFTENDAVIGQNVYLNIPVVFHKDKGITVDQRLTPTVITAALAEV